MLEIQLKAKLSMLKKEARKIGAENRIYVNKLKSEHFVVTGWLFKKAEIKNEYEFEQDIVVKLFGDVNDGYIWKIEEYENAKKVYLEKLEEIFKWFVDQTGFDEDVASYEMAYNWYYNKFRTFWRGC